MGEKRHNDGDEVTREALDQAEDLVTFARACRLDFRLLAAPTCKVSVPHCGRRAPSPNSTRAFWV
jgi:hypothetical protein